MKRYPVMPRPVEETLGVMLQTRCPKLQAQLREAIKTRKPVFLRKVK